MGTQTLQQMGSASRNVSEELRHKHIRTLEVLQKLVSENKTLRKQLGLGDTGTEISNADSQSSEVVDALQRELSQAQQDLAASSAEIAELKAALQTSQSEVAQLKSTASSLASDLQQERDRAALRQKSPCSSCSDLKRQLREQRALHTDTLTRTDAAAASRDQAAAAELKALRAKCKELSKACAAADEAKGKAELQVHACQLREADAQRELSKVKLLADSAKSRADYEEKERLATDTLLQCLCNELSQATAALAAQAKQTAAACCSVTPRSAEKTVVLPDVGAALSLPATPRTVQTSSDHSSNGTVRDSSGGGGGRRGSNASTLSNSSNNQQQQQQQQEAFDTLRRENDRLRMQLGEQKQAQAMLLLRSSGGKSALSDFGGLGRGPVRGGRALRHSSIS
jgi:hypothetical protein